MVIQSLFIHILQTVPVKKIPLVEFELQKFEYFTKILEWKHALTIHRQMFCLLSKGEKIILNLLVR